ncbi:MAG: putative DNA-binding domain-containing protein [Myxococcota bacterium]
MTEHVALSSLEPMIHQLLFAAEPTPVAGLEPEAQAIYRRLVRKTLFRVVENAIPVTRGLLGDARMGELLTAWLDQAPPTTRILREVPDEFVAWLATQPQLEGGLTELVHFEVLELAVTHGPDPEPEVVHGMPASPHLEHSVVTHPCTRLAVYEHPVYTLVRGATRLPGKTSSPSFVLAYRAAEKMHWVTVPRDVAMVLFRTAHGHSLGEALRDLAETGYRASEPLVRSWLVNLRHRGAILGFPRAHPEEST